MLISKSISYNIEIQSGTSITQRGERLDFKTLLARSAAGIIDLSTFQLPRSCDISGNKDSAELEKDKYDLLDRPSSVMDNCFGSSIEEAEAELQRHQRVMADNRKPSEPPAPKEPPAKEPPALKEPPAKEPPAPKGE